MADSDILLKYRQPQNARLVMNHTKCVPSVIISKMPLFYSIAYLNWSKRMFLYERWPCVGQTMCNQYSLMICWNVLNLKRPLKYNLYFELILTYKTMLTLAFRFSNINIVDHTIWCKFEYIPTTLNSIIENIIKEAMIEGV